MIARQAPYLTTVPIEPGQAAEHCADPAGCDGLRRAMHIDELLSSIDRLIETDASPIIDESENSGVFPKTLVQRLCAMGIPNLVHGSAQVEAPPSLFCQIIER